MGTLQIWGEMLVTSRSNLIISGKRDKLKKRYASVLIELAYQHERHSVIFEMVSEALREIFKTE